MCVLELISEGARQYGRRVALLSCFQSSKLFFHINGVYRNRYIMKIQFPLFQRLIICIFFALILTSCGKKLTGDFVPTRFEWSGGSGRVSISCEKVTVSEEGAVAEITFSSPHYDYVRIDTEKIYGDHSDKTSVFSVPVELDKDMELMGCTSAMSKPHEISYTILVSIDERYSGGESEKGDPENKSEDSRSYQGGMAQASEKDSWYSSSERDSDHTSSEEYSAHTSSEEDSANTASVNDSSDLRELVKEALISERDDTLLSYPAISGLSFDHSMELSFAKCFSVHYFKSENSDSPYKLISVLDGRNYLLVPEGGDVPGNLPKDITVLRQPLKDVYLAATGAMSLFNVLDELSLIKYTGTDISGWDIEAPREAIKSGKMTFAGKYSAPDYEMLIDGGCDLAIESTMILHSPETKEQLENVGIPVFIDWSSYETDALGRTEWVKLYGAMTDHENEAENFFREEVSRSGLKEGFEKTGKTVAFFYFNSRGLAVVRNSDDYIPKMIRDGGGDYVFDSLKEKSDSISVDISMEEFYATAADADYIIYNGSIDSSVETLRDLVTKNSLLADFRAVKDANVYIVDKEFYQSTDTVSEFARDVHLMLSGDTGGMKFLKKMQ